MICKRIKDVREDNDFTQDFVAYKLNVSRSTYANWENGDIIIPLNKLDELAMLYNVSIGYLIGESKKNSEKLKPINNDYLLKILYNLKRERKCTYKEIGNAIGVYETTIYKYFHGDRHIPVDKLILLAKFFNYDIDELLGKV